MSNLEIYKKPDSLLKYREQKDFISMTPGNATIELRHVKTENDLLVSVQNSETPSIAKLKKHHGEDKAIAYLGIWIADLNVSLGVKNTMDPDRIKECAFFIIDDYYYLTLADFKLFFTSIKRGKYGKMFESIGTPKIMAWLEEYVISRTLLFENSEPIEDKPIRERKKLNTGGSIKELTESLEIRKNLSNKRK